MKRFTLSHANRATSCRMNSTASRLRLATYPISPKCSYRRSSTTFCDGCTYDIHVPFAPGPLPNRNSAPKFERMNTGLPNTSKFRTSHGAIVAQKKIPASVAPATAGTPRFLCLYTAHNPEAGRNASREVLVSPATPQSTPKPIHGTIPSSSSILSVSQKLKASRSAARLVSQTHRVHQYITDGSNAQAQAVQTATFSLKHFRAIRKVGMHVSAEKILLMESRMNADPWV